MMKIVIFFVYIIYLCQACDIALQVQPSSIEFEGSILEPIQADILVSEDDIEVKGDIYLVYDGPCSNQKFQDLLSENDIQISTKNETLKLSPDPVSAVVEPSGFLGFLAGLFTDIQIDLTNVTLALFSDPFSLSAKGNFSSNITVEVKSGEGRGSASLIPGGLSDIDLTGQTYSMLIQGVISQDAEDNIVLTIPEIKLSLDIDIQGASVSFDLDGDFLAEESD